MLRTTPAVLIVFGMMCAAPSAAVAQSPAPKTAKQAAIEHFEKKVRPLLTARCFKCHGEKKQRGGLRLDGAAGIKKGGESGSPIKPGKPADSLLVRAVRQTSKLKMPADGRLKQAEIAALEKWIKDGALWPDALPQQSRATPARSGTVVPIEPNDSSLAGALQLWLRADALRFQDGEPVIAWTDRSGRGHDLTPTAGVRAGGVGKPPKFVAHSNVNRRPAVRFDRESGIAGSPDHPLDIQGDAPLTIILVAKFERNEGAPPYDNLLFIGNPAGNPGNPGKPLAALIEIERTKPDAHQLDFAGGYGHDASLGPGSAKALYDGPHILSITKTPGPMTAGTRFSLDGYTSQEWLGRAPTGSTAVPDFQHRTDVGVSMGKVQGWAGSFRGDVAEVIIYNRALSETELRGVETALASRYGLLQPHMIAHAAHTFTEKEKSYWAFQPVNKPQPPELKDASWPSAPIDRFILARLEARGIEPAPPADRRTLIRRVTYDLIGLPPTPAAVAAFVGDPAPDRAAFAKVVDRLLASAHYGERWGRQWLDNVRYADTTANDGNFVMRYAYRYRDYVVGAFNSDKPYDQFIVEQLAGDLLPPHEDPRITAEHIIATGFLMVGPKALAETDKEQVKIDIVDEQIDVTGRAFLGLTIGCARCHNHKFDPIPTVDYYSIAGIFRSTEMFKDLIRNASMWMEFPVPAGPGSEPITVMAPKEGVPVNLRVHKRGNRFNLGGITPRRFLQIIAGENHAPISTLGSGRLELGRWIASPDNPLTPRVMANRIWQGHFGRGIVATSGNFGKLGQQPTHPELLDWLAASFIESGWSIKTLHRYMLLSSTYRMSSAVNRAAGQLDPDNRLLSRMPRRRLEAEQLRDAILMVSGQLDDRIGGDDIVKRVYEAGQAIDKERGVVSASTINSSWEGFNTPRRSIYLPVIRNGQPDVLALFDVADANAVTPVRNETTVSSQTSFLLNNPFVRAQALHFAKRLLADAPTTDAPATDAQRLRAAYRSALSREPTDEELAAATDYLTRYTQALQQTGLTNPESRTAAWQSYCQLLLCLNEFIYVD